MAFEYILAEGRTGTYKVDEKHMKPEILEQMLQWMYCKEITVSSHTQLMVNTVNILTKFINWNPHLFLCGLMAIMFAKCGSRYGTYPYHSTGTVPLYR